jgi:hypothetical protein
VTYYENIFIRVCPNRNLLRTANCARQKTEEKRRLTKEYTIEYSALLQSVVEISAKYQKISPSQHLGSIKQQQSLVEGAYLVRILDKLIVEIESFLSDCRDLGLQ